ncbi:MAG TPA: SRPBCC domain-containing protein [Candidatus Polarisedimenticolia bacterium]|nr:SRPBCC domain-containing protein [Candidatus Polarisedimenticolia bacterium]
MPVKKEANGRRSIQVEVEVPGTPEQVWQAIATGPGISAWFVPTEMIEPGPDGKPTKMKMEFAPGMESAASITAYDAPRRLAAEDSWGPDSPVIATEWTVEARSGGTCLVRVVHSLFAETDDWDNQLEGVENGWPGFFRILKNYLANFRGQRSASIQAMGMGGSSVAEVWSKLLSGLNLSDAREGQRVRATVNGASISGVVGTVVPIHKALKHEEATLQVHLDEPVPGVLALGANNCMGGPMATIYFYLYGNNADSVVKRDAEKWQGWMAEKFPMPQM